MLRGSLQKSMHGKPVKFDFDILTDDDLEPMLIARRCRMEYDFEKD